MGRTARQSNISRTTSRREKNTLQRFLADVWALGRSTFTVMVIPHSEQKIVNFKISVFAVAFSFVVLSTVFATSVYLATAVVGSSSLVSSKSVALERSEASLDSILDELNQVIHLTRDFETAVSETISSMNHDSEEMSAVSKSALPTSFGFGGAGNNAEPPEVTELARLADVLRESVPPLQGVQGLMSLRESLLTDIPTGWPLVAGRGVVTMEWGPNIHPVFGNWYMHTGIDIWDATGAPVLAGADGVVSGIAWDPFGYGNYIWVRHKYGFRTRYSHLNSVDVREGQVVTQGQRIGTIGATGLATGPHLDYEIWLGADVLDPAHFLKLQNTFNRRLPNQRVVRQ